MPPLRCDHSNSRRVATGCPDAGPRSQNRQAAGSLFSLSRLWPGDERAGIARRQKGQVPALSDCFCRWPRRCADGGLTPLDVPEASWSEPSAASSGGLTPLDTDDLFASLPPAPQLAAAPLPPAANPLGYTPSPHRFGSGGERCPTRMRHRAWVCCQVATFARASRRSSS